MRQGEIINEIKRMCGNVKPLPRGIGWTFMYNGNMYVYMVGNDDGMIRFTIPFAAGIHSQGISTQHKERLVEAVNATNRNVKFIKALLSEKDETKVSLDYDHKMADTETAKDIVSHIISVLDFAAGYLRKKINEDR